MSRDMIVAPGDADTDQRLSDTEPGTVGNSLVLTLARVHVWSPSWGANTGHTDQGGHTGLDTDNSHKYNKTRWVPETQTDNWLVILQQTF